MALQIFQNHVSQFIATLIVHRVPLPSLYKTNKHAGSPRVIKGASTPSNRFIQLLSADQTPASSPPAQWQRSPSHQSSEVECMHQ